jgi:tRNA(Ile)-lysidine synthase
MPLAYHAMRLAGRPPPGDSVEAWARRERYAALERLAQEHDCSIVLLAHHRSDQAETVLLQALRGAGPAGLAAMPKLVERAGISWARPWLERSRQDVEAYLRRHRLSYVDDPSNASSRFLRNRLRHDAWPTLLECFPDAETTLQAVARRAHEAAEVAREMATLDTMQVVVAGRLQVALWLRLGTARRRNVMRSWLAAVADGPVPESLLDRLESELPPKRSGCWPAGLGQLWLHGGSLSWSAIGRLPSNVAPATVVLDLSAAGCHSLPGWCGHLIVAEVAVGGVEVQQLRSASVRPRGGAEQFQFAPTATARSLKKQFQARGVPPWERCGPLIWAGSQLVFVARLGLDARCMAAPGVPQRTLRWVAGEGVPSGSAG